MIGPGGAKHFAEALVVNQSLTSLKYARKCTRPLITDLINCHKALAANDSACLILVVLRSIASNNLVGSIYVNASEVEGESKEVGAKVTYQGREMTVSEGVDDDGDLAVIDLSGIFAFAEMIKSNTVLRDLKYASSCAALQSD